VNGKFLEKSGGGLFEELFLILTAKIEVSRQNLSHGSRYPGRDLKKVPPECKSRALQLLHLAQEKDLMLCDIFLWCYSPSRA
jgi:hypothetical protein